MVVKFRGRYQKELFFRAVRLANRSRNSSRWVQPVMFVFTVVAIAVLVYRLVISGDILGNAAYITVVMIAGGFMISTYLQPYLAARKLWANKNLQEELRGTVSNEGIDYKLKQGNNLISWTRIYRVRRMVNLSTLVTRDGLLLVFPRYFFTSDQGWRKFNDLVDSRVISV